MREKLKGFFPSSKADLYSILQKAEVDRAVFYGVSARAWGVISGPVTALMIATKFSPEVQGYYYTFANLLALQIFVELGLGVVIVQFASHEWSRLSLSQQGEITGDPEALSKLSSLATVALKWFLIGGLIVVLGLGFGGHQFFSRSPASDVNWVSPWFLLCTLTGANICLIPIWSLLEGCNQVSVLYFFRLWQGLFASLSIWAAIYFGANLWVASISTVVSLICAAMFIMRKYWNFLKSLLACRPGGPGLDWRGDILPMQWRFALSSISGYFVFSFFTPVLFHYHGPLIAGQFGMTWSVVGLIGSISSAWIAPKIPQFGMMIARKNYDVLDNLFWRITKVVVAVAFLLSICCWLCIYVINILNYSIAARFLPIIPTAILLLAQTLITISMPFSSYLRAHKKEPLLLVSVVSGILTGLSTLVLGKHYAANGVAVGYLTVNMMVLPSVIIIWHRSRKAWHF
jgi:O-antigen/teichoic acid export membrane protein